MKGARGWHLLTGNPNIWNCILITSLIYSIWTHWGFFKHKWVTVKWGIFALQMVFGIGFLNR
jgi:hypothetical protein